MEQQIIEMEFETVDPIINMSPVEKAKIITKLKSSAEKCRNQADKINTEVSGNWTHRRQSFADSAQKKKDTLLKRAETLEKLAQKWKDETIYPLLRRIRTAANIDTILYSGYPTPPTEDDLEDGWYRKQYQGRLKRITSLGIHSKQDAGIAESLIIELGKVTYTEEELKERELKQKLNLVHTYNIPGFFPTPDKLIDKLIDLAYIEPGNVILEPSAGIGSIADKLRELDPDIGITCVELSPSLCEILTLKGYNTWCRDILEIPGGEMILPDLFDRIIMNPPFEKGQDMEHVRHCFDNLLKPGGFLVSIMASGVLHNTTKKFQEFRDFVMENNGHFYVNGQEFRKAFNPTGVATVTLSIQKPV